MELILITVLCVVSAAFITLYLRERKFNTDIKKRRKEVETWLQVHADLQRASSATITLRRLNQDYFFYREPPQ